MTLEKSEMLNSGRKSLKISTCFLSLEDLYLSKRVLIFGVKKRLIFIVY